MKTAKFTKMIMITLCLFLILGLPTQAFATETASEETNTNETEAIEATETTEDTETVTEETQSQEAAVQTAQTKPVEVTPAAVNVTTVKSTATASSITVTWAAAANAKEYELEVSTEQSFKDKAKVQTVETKTTKATKSGLKAGTTYWVKVKSINGSKERETTAKAAKTTAAASTTVSTAAVKTTSAKTTTTTASANTVKTFNYSTCAAQLRSAAKGGKNYFQLAKPVSKAAVKSVESNIQNTLPYAEPISLMSVRISGNKVTAYCFNVNNYKKMISQNAKIKNQVKKIAKTKAMKFNKKTTQKAKVMKIAQYIANHSRYSYTRHSVEDNMLRGQSSCGGYAYAFKSMCKYYGISCKVVYGYNKRSEGHAWNRVKVGGAWYNIDVCWYDSGKNGKYTSKYGLKKGLWADHKQYKYQGYTEV